MTFFASADRESQEPPQGASVAHAGSALNLKKAEPVVRSFPQDYAQWLDELSFGGDWAQALMLEGWAPHA